MSKNLRSHAVIFSGTGASDIWILADELQSTLTSSGHRDTNISIQVINLYDPLKTLDKI